MDCDGRADRSPGLDRHRISSTTRSTLNLCGFRPIGPGSASVGEPRSFAYGHLPLYLQSLAGHALAILGEGIAQIGIRASDLSNGIWAEGHLSRAVARVDHIRRIRSWHRTLVGRLAFGSCLTLGTVFLVYLLGYASMIGGRANGAALTASSVMHTSCPTLPRST